jgi:hypothetical protein
VASEAFPWRMDQIERRHENLVKKVEEIDRGGTSALSGMKVEMLHMKEDLIDLHDDIRSLRRALYTTAVSVSGSAIIFAITIFASLR